jgi:hypothetical protein
VRSIRGKHYYEHDLLDIIKKMENGWMLWTKNKSIRNHRSFESTIFMKIYREVLGNCEIYF